MSSESQPALSTVDWDFQDADTDKYSASLHPYHARFIPQLPEQLINLYTDPQDTVLDPFNGSGTTTMAAIATNRHAIGVDRNPLASLIARVKSRVYDMSKLRAHVETFLPKLERRVRTVDDQQRLTQFGSGTLDDVPVRIPEFPDQDSWYMPSVLNQMGAIYHCITEIDDTPLREFYLVCFSAITKHVSRTTEDYTYIGDNMKPDTESNSLTPDNTVHDVYTVFENRVEKNVEAVADLAAQHPTTDADIYERDALALTDYVDEDVADCCITSPPYVNAVDYARYNRLSFYWLGYPIKETFKREIGARSKRKRKNAVEDYYEEMKTVYSHVHSVLKPGSQLCIVIGNSKANGETIDAVQQTIDLCEEVGFTHVDEATRSLEKQTMSQKSITSETIHVFTADDE